MVMVECTGVAGGIVMFTRDPSFRRASTIGVPSSTRRPICERMRSATRRTCPSSRKVMSLGWMTPSRSKYTWSGAFTITSVTLLSSTSAWMGPSPRTSSATSETSRCRTSP